MKKYITKTYIILTMVVAVFSSCKKEKEEAPSTIGLVSLHNAALLLPRPAIVLIDNKRVNNNNVITYLSNITGNWVGAEAGNRTLAIKDTTSSVTTNWATKSFVSTAGKAISFFTYDTLNQSTGSVRILALNTDLTAPAANRSHIRFLHLSPDAPAVDVVLLRVNDARTGYVDSLKITNVPFVGSTPNEAALSNLTSIPFGLYHIRVRPAGTFTNAVSVGTTFTTGSTFINGKIYSIYARGFLNNTGTGRSTATALGATVVLHNP